MRAIRQLHASLSEYALPENIQSLIEEENGRAVSAAGVRRLSVRAARRSTSPDIVAQAINWGTCAGPGVDCFDVAFLIWSGGRRVGYLKSSVVGVGVHGCSRENSALLLW